MSDSVTCPFCGVDDFDLIGLKMHLQRGWCDEYEEVGRDHEPAQGESSKDDGG